MPVDAVLEPRKFGLGVPARAWRGDLPFRRPGFEAKVKPMPSVPKNRR